MKYNVLVYKIAGQAKVPITSDSSIEEAKEFALDAARHLIFEKPEKEFITEIEKG